MKKRIKLTIEWDGACSEFDWAISISEAIEKHDASGVTKVVDAELLTTLGTTEPRELNHAEQVESDRRLTAWRIEYRKEHPTIWSRLFA